MEDCPLNRFYSPAQCVRYLEALPRRYSCRAYAASPNAEQLAALNYAAARVCLPGTHIVIADCAPNLFFSIPVVGGIRGTGKCAYVITDDALHLPRTQAGVSGEAFVLEAAAMGVQTCWVTGTYRRSLTGAALGEGERLAALIALGIASDPTEAPAHKRKPLAQICLSAPSEWPLWAYKAADAVRQAPSAVNLQPWKLSYGQRTLRLLGKKADSVDMGIAMLHMEAAAGNVRHTWVWGSDRCVAHLIAEEEV